MFFVHSARKKINYGVTRLDGVTRGGPPPNDASLCIKNALEYAIFRREKLKKISGREPSPLPNLIPLITPT